MRIYKGLVLGLLRGVASSTTEKLFEENVNKMKDSDIWNSDQSGKLRDWINNTWLPSHRVRLLILYLSFA